MFYFDTSAMHEPTSSKVRYFKADSESDVAKLPTTTTEGTQTEGSPILNETCAAGSEVFVLDPPSVYMLNSSGQWLEL